MFRRHPRAPWGVLVLAVERRALAWRIHERLLLPERVAQVVPAGPEVDRAARPQQLSHSDKLAELVTELLTARAPRYGELRCASEARFHRVV